MTTASWSSRIRRPLGKSRFWRSGFSLVEVVVATGLCTYALVIIACLLPMGLGTVQIANGQIVESEVFNRIWLEVNSTPFYSLPAYPRFKNGVYPDSSANVDGLSYFDKDGGELGQNTNTSVTGAKPSAVYFVYCTLINPSASAASTLPPNLPSGFLARLPTLGPPIDGLGTSANSITPTSTGGSGLNLVRVQIGFHVDPSGAALSATDSRVASRTFVIAKRDTSNGN